MVAILILLLLGLVSGCHQEPRAPDQPEHQATAAPPGTVEADRATQRALDALTTAVLRSDRAGFKAGVDRTDPGAVAFVDQLYANLARLPLTHLEFQLRGPRRPADPGSTGARGSDAWTQEVTVRWRLADDGGTAQHRLLLTLRSEAGRTRLAGVPSPADSGPGTELSAVPLWLEQPLAVRRADRVTVLAGDPAAADVWLARGRAAVRAVAARLPAQVAPGWASRLVVEVPATRQSFERVLGVAPGSYAEIAAVAWPAGPDPADAAVRVVVNPAVVARLDATGAAVLLAHEVVHVATHSVVSAAPTWLVEGYADYLAYAAYPQAQPAATRDLLADVRASGPPRRLPADADFAPGSAGLALRYAAAWTACRFLAEDSSPAALAQFYRLASAGASLDSAARTALGIDVGTLTARWRADLVAQAEPDR